jgi:hypothetical protein
MRTSVAAAACGLALAVTAQASRQTAAQPGAPDGPRVYLPLAVHAVSAERLPTPAAATPLAPTATRRPTETPVTPPPTFTPLPTWTPEPTEPPVPSLIEGHIVFDGDPLPEGFGSPGGPQIELRLCESEGGQPCPLEGWRRAAAAMTDKAGRFAFRSPPPLTEGQLYQVWWVNDDTPDAWGDSRFLNRWWSRVVDAFGPGDTVDLGTFDVTDLKYKFPLHDMLHSLPIPFRWTARSNRHEKYRWSLFRGCGDIANREKAYRTPLLGHASDYELTAPPPGFRLEEKYCWYIFIEDGSNGTGWPFFDWRITFLPTPDQADLPDGSAPRPNERPT